MASFVRIALAGAGTFAEVNIVEGDTISRLAKRACTEFPHWGTADKLSLYLVAAGGKDTPSPSAVDSARHLDQIGWSLEDAGISSGAWLVARKIVDGGESCISFARVSPRTPHSSPHLSSPPPHLQVHPSLAAAAAGVAEAAVAVAAVAVATLLRSSAPL